MVVGAVPGNRCHQIDGGHAATATVVCGQNTEGGKEQKKKERNFRRRVGADTLVLEDLVVIIDASTDGASK